MCAPCLEGVYKVRESVGEEYQAVKSEKGISWLWSVDKNITRKKGLGKQYHISYNIKAVGKNIKWGRGKGDGTFGEDLTKILKMGVGEEYQVIGNFLQPWCLMSDWLDSTSIPSTVASIRDSSSPAAATPKRRVIH